MFPGKHLHPPPPIDHILKGRHEPSPVTKTTIPGGLSRARSLYMAIWRSRSGTPFSPSPSSLLNNDTRTPCAVRRAQRFLVRAAQSRRRGPPSEDDRLCTDKVACHSQSVHGTVRLESCSAPRRVFLLQ